MLVDHSAVVAVCSLSVNNQYKVSISMFCYLIHSWSLTV